MYRTIESVGEASAEVHHALCQLYIRLLKVQDNGLSALEAIGKILRSLIETGWFHYTHLAVRTEEVAARGLWIRNPLFLFCMLKPRR